MSGELPNGYDPSNVEDIWYQRWLDNDCFVADANSDKEPFTIVIPPPNVTGSLHMGHAMYTLQDILSRWKRMDGYEVLWLPGTDHAGIATQMVVERKLQEEGLTRHELGREKFLERVWQWREEYGDRIYLQLRRLGFSLDWSRTRFTMDEGLSRAVREVFVRLYNDDLIYQDDRLVNWDPVSQTVLSDLEVEQEEEDGHLWHIAYPVVGSDEQLVVATTRPETLLGDSAVAIHPDDERYQHLHGKSVALPLTDRTIPIVCDPEAADMEFGSGAVKVTPAHDFDDFETGKRNKLERHQVIGLDAKMTQDCPERFAGLDRFDARKKIVGELKDQGLLIEEESYRFMPSRSQRSGTIVEPLSVGKQWYVRMAPLAAPAIEAVRNGDIEILPAHWKKTYYHWMENIRDWCISRQLWWGHRIPAWTCGECDHITVARETPNTCEACGSSELAQEEDVLDTWFSSGLWPFSTLGWPEKTADLKKFYPTSVMETGFDIIFFWVARMIFFGLYFTDEVPFHTVFLHAMVRDQHGQKMSKTKGNVIDPLHMIDGFDPDELDDGEKKLSRIVLEEFPDGLQAQGADALRFTLAMYAAAGRDIKLDVQRVSGYKAFANKLWNAARFALMNLEDYEPQSFDPSTETLSPADQWILSRLRKTAASVQAHLEEYAFSDAAHALYNFVWHELCDWYLELSKPILYGDDFPVRADRTSTQRVLVYVLDKTLRLLHPFMPFITEEIWQRLPLAERDNDFLCLAEWPRAETIVTFDESSAIDTAIAVTTGIRRIRGESNVPPSKPVSNVFVLTDDQQQQTELSATEAYILRLAKAESMTIGPVGTERPDKVATTVEDGMEIIIPIAGLIDVEAERERIHGQLETADEDIAFFENKLANPQFVENAPDHIVQKDRDKLAAAKEKRATLVDGLKRLE